MSFLKAINKPKDEKPITEEMVEPEVKPAVSKKVKPVKPVKPRPVKPTGDRESVISRPSGSPATIPKVLDEDILEPLFLDLKKHHRALGNWMFRHRGFDRASASFIIKFYRKLKSEGFE